MCMCSAWAGGGGRVDDFVIYKGIFYLCTCAVPELVAVDELSILVLTCIFYFWVCAVLTPKMVDIMLIVLYIRKFDLNFNLCTCAVPELVAVDEMLILLFFREFYLNFLFVCMHIAQCLSWWRWTRWARPCGRNTLSLGARSSSAVSWPTTGRTLRFPSGRAAAPTAVAVGGWSTKEIREGNYSTFFRKLFNFLGIQEKIF